MLGKVVTLGALLTAISIVGAAASALQVNGGTIQGFRASLPVVPPSTPAPCTAAGLSFTPANTITGTNGMDFLVVPGSTGKLVLALGGIDFVAGGAGRDCIDGGDGNDLLKGFGGNDVILGGNGNDTIFGGDGDDVIDGGPGYDVCVGGPGTDVITNCELVYQGDEPSDDDGHCSDSHDLQATTSGGAGGGSSHDDDDCSEECGDGAKKSDASSCDSRSAVTSGTSTTNGGLPGPAAATDATATTTPEATATVTPSKTAKATPTGTATPTPTRTPTPTATATPTLRAPAAKVTGVAIYKK